MIAPAEQLDLHLRRHGIGSCGDGGIRFDWPAMAERNLHLIPAYEADPAPVYESALRLELPVCFYGSDGESRPVPDPVSPDFFVEVEAAVPCLTHPDGGFIYVSFYTEEAYLAVTAERAREVFDATPGDMLAHSLLRAAGNDVLRMLRHRHGLRIFADAARHHCALQRKLGLPEPESSRWC